MTDKSYNNWNTLSDSALLQEVGHYIKRMRQQQNKTQGELAKSASVSRSTLSLLENGEAGSLKTLIQILRVLDKLHVFQSFQFIAPISPLALAKKQHKDKVRVRPSTKTKKNTKKLDW